MKNNLATLKFAEDFEKYSEMENSDKIRFINWWYLYQFHKGVPTFGKLTLDDLKIQCCNNLYKSVRLDSVIELMDVTDSLQLLHQKLLDAGDDYLSYRIDRNPANMERMLVFRFKPETDTMKYSSIVRDFINKRIAGLYRVMRNRTVRCYENGPDRETISFEFLDRTFRQNFTIYPILDSFISSNNPEHVATPDIVLTYTEHSPEQLTMLGDSKATNYVEMIYGL